MIVVEDLTKRYGAVEAVSDVSFEVEAGEVFALLGPNGAGKTSTIEILEGFRRRDSGRVQVLGLDPADRATSALLRERTGVVLQELAVEPYLTVREVLERNAGYYPAPREPGEVIDLVGLSEKARSRVKSLSGGQMRRFDLGLGIIGNPEVLYLDEPTTGFDPSARRDAWDVVRRLTSGGATVLLTTRSRRRLGCRGLRGGRAPLPVRAAADQVAAKALSLATPARRRSRCPAPRGPGRRGEPAAPTRRPHRRARRRHGSRPASIRAAARRGRRPARSPSG